MTLNDTGRVLFERQWLGNAEHTIEGEPVRTSSPGFCFIRSLRTLSTGDQSSLSILEDVLELQFELLLLLVLPFELLGELAPEEEAAVADSAFVVLAAMLTEELELESGEPIDSTDDTVE